MLQHINCLQNFSAGMPSLLVSKCSLRSKKNFPQDNLLSGNLVFVCYSVHFICEDVLVWVSFVCPFIFINWFSVLYIQLVQISFRSLTLVSFAQLQLCCARESPKLKCSWDYDAKDFGWGFLLVLFFLPYRSKVKSQDWTGLGVWLNNEEQE